MADNNSNINVNGTELADTAAQSESQGAKTYTEEEVQALLQSESDRRVNQALAKQKKQYEKQLSLSALDTEARVQAEKDLRIQELEEQLKEFNVLQAKTEVVKVLNERGLNPQFADILAIGDDTAAAQQTIETLDKLVKAAVQGEVKKRLNSNVPSVGADSNETITKESFKKMTLAQRTALFQNDPELYKQLSR